MLAQEMIDHWCATVRASAAQGLPLQLRGNGSKDWYGGKPTGELLEVSKYTGITSYESAELVISARCGTPLAEIEMLLASRGQCLPFEPPVFNGASALGIKLGEQTALVGSSIGGAVASGLSGPARPSVGSLRDYVLGASLINGRGEHLHFGGTVIKNVAGYDVSRLLAGSLGTLGIITDLSIKVLPFAVATASLKFEMSEAKALQTINAWSGRPLPINASAWWNGALLVRLSGAAAAVDSAYQQLGGELIEPEPAGEYWHGLREQTNAFFADVTDEQALWRLSVPPTSAPLGSATGLGDTLIEWGGGQRWLRAPSSGVQAELIRHAARVAGGHATLHRGGDKLGGVFAPLDSVQARIQHEVKKAFDPHGVFNRGRLYPDF